MQNKNFEKIEHYLPQAQDLALFTLDLQFKIFEFKILLVLQKQLEMEVFLLSPLCSTHLKMGVQEQKLG